MSCTRCWDLRPAGAREGSARSALTVAVMGSAVAAVISASYLSVTQKTIDAEPDEARNCAKFTLYRSMNMGIHSI
ncbi:hypothetical protein CFB47_20285 [Burkholderia sp. AU27893]|uniref:Uncharacterized protein n=1 Tax=Burkholderia contaminans TaxID=488447 RepID=A0A2S5E5S4_9BURK|nr:hypothetical protein CFB47_20285 [Burkholderia sp. AU27893]POZ86644.1 hypothetical protein C3743_09300 [Burkholderia contaminans]